MVNISSGSREQLTKWDQQTTDSAVSINAETLQNLFIDAQQEIFELLCADPLYRFQRTATCNEIEKAFNSRSLFINEFEIELTENKSMTLDCSTTSLNVQA